MTDRAVRYGDTFRRALLDMHIPDWDPSFLRDYHPERLADLYRRAGVTGVLVVAKSHLGLNYWPAPVGGIHAACRGRDLLGEILGHLRERDIAPAIYHSVVFDNWAVDRHPDWAVQPLAGEGRTGRRLFGPRYGTACMNHPDYRAYEHTQIRELVRRYDTDALWIDMAFWTAICGCEHCRRRFRDEDGTDLPLVVEWDRRPWAAFQAARQRWAEEFYLSIVAAARSQRPALPVTHNLAPGLGGWLRGQTAHHARHDSFAAGDLYGGADEHCLVAKLMAHLGRSRPAEFMTTRTAGLRSHVQSRSEHDMLVHAFASLSQGHSVLFIDAIDPRGTVSDAVYEQLGRVFAAIAPYEGMIRGTPVEDVAVYYSDTSLIDPADTGRPVSDPLDHGVRQLPHMAAVLGAVRALQQAHLPFGVMTRDRLDRLADHRVIVLPDALRLDAEEIDALRAYVAAGGRLYSSGRTSLMDTSGVRHHDFALADVFGAHLDGYELGDGVFLRAEAPSVRAALAPDRFLPYGFGTDITDQQSVPLQLPRLAVGGAGRTLGSLTVPYGYPSPGSRANRDFASIHSSPPWEDLAAPVLVGNSYGSGRSVYSALPLEALDTDAGRSVFTALLRELLAERPRFEAEAHPDVWVTAFDDAEGAGVVFSFARYETHPAAATTPVTVRYRPAPATRIESIRSAVDGRSIPHSVRADGTVEFSLPQLRLFDLVVICSAAGQQTASGAGRSSLRAREPDRISP